MLVYHGTDYKKEILSNGFMDIHKSNGWHFGKGIYLTDSKDNAQSYGNDILEIEIDESKLLHFNGMSEINAFSLSILPYNFENYFLYCKDKIGFLLNECDGEKLIYVPYYKQSEFKICNVLD